MFIFVTLCMFVFVTLCMLALIGLNVWKILNFLFLLHSVCCFCNTLYVCFLLHSVCLFLLHSVCLFLLHSVCLFLLHSVCLFLLHSVCLFLLHSVCSKFEKFEVGKVRSWKRSKLEKIDVTKVQSSKCSKIIIIVAYTNRPTLSFSFLLHSVCLFLLHRNPGTEFRKTSYLLWKSLF